VVLYAKALPSKGVRHAATHIKALFNSSNFSLAYEMYETGFVAIILLPSNLCLPNPIARPPIAIPAALIIEATAGKGACR
jgi:hypothetical protein